MAKWVLQSVYSSVSKRARSRTKYLGALVPRVDRIIGDYFDRRPDGEDVTVEVLRHLGRDKLVELGGAGRLDTTKQDVGLLVVLRLVDIFTAARIATHRENDGKAVSTRPSRNGPDWVNRYTPHRLMPVATADRIVLDTNAARAVIHGDPEALKLQELAQLKGHHPVSIADHAWGELVRQLYEARIPFKDWAARIRQFRLVLDPDQPIAPSGREAAAMSGLEADPKFDLQQMQAYFRAVWNYVESATSVKDFGRTQEFEAPSGQRYQIGPLTLDRLQVAFKQRAMLWQNLATRLKIEGPLPADPVDHLAENILASLAAGMDVAKSDRLNLAARVIAHYAVRVNDPNHPYVPEGPNDAIDFDVLFCVSLPAIVCTSDGAMLKLARACGSGDGWRVMGPKELLGWLARDATGETITPNDEGAN